MTVKVPPKGTRGVSFPRFLARLGNGMMVRRFRGRGAHTRGGVPAVILETVGAKSGQPRKAILGYLEEGSDPGC